MSSAYGKIERPKEYNATQLKSSLPIESQTKANKLVSVHSLNSILEKLDDQSSLLSYLQSLLNTEIEAGNTYPQKNPLNSSEFQNYFLSADAFVAINGGKTLPNGFEKNLEENILGMFYIKPNFPGRCSHVIMETLNYLISFFEFRFVMVDLLHQVFIEIKELVVSWP